jgi:hypothetical protein
MNKDKTLQEFIASLGCLLLGVAILAWVVITSGCSHNVPAIDASFWAGDPLHSGISRSQENKTLSCSDPSFNDYVCLTYGDLKKIYDTILQCKDWGSALASDEERAKMLRVNYEIISNVIGRESE